MNFSKYFAFLAVLALCLLGQYAAEAGFLGKIGQEVESGAHDVEGGVEHVASDVGSDVKSGVSDVEGDVSSGVSHVKTAAKTVAKVVVHDGKDVVKVVEIAGDIATAAKIIKIVQILS